MNSIINNQMIKDSDTYIKKLIKEKDYKLVVGDIDDSRLYEILVSKIKKTKSNGTSIVVLVGGVASGKTTLARELVKKLKSADSITTDAFAAKTREYRHKNYGKVDKKYDLKLFNKKISELRSLDKGESMRFPVYDGKTGIAAAAGEENFPKQVSKTDYFIIEGDFNFLDDPSLFIYLHVPDEVRINNRIARDKEQRGWDDIEKLKQDIRVREEKQHFPFTLPFAEEADVLLLVGEDNGRYSYSVYEK